MLLKAINPVPVPPGVIIIAYMLDLMLGDPACLSHPVIWIGRAISSLEDALRSVQAESKNWKRAAGVILGLTIAVLVYSLTAALLYLAYRFSTIIFFLLSTYVVWMSLSVKTLKDEARGVLRSLSDEGIEAARISLSRIVGRDTGELSEKDVLKAAVESVSENTCDGIVAPLFYLTIGGPALMAAYKAINTLDSMVGYKDDRYLYFGWFPARLDDAANFIPARVTSALMVMASFVLGYNWRRSCAIAMRDGKNHPSPNSGYPEAAVAGALGIKLGGSSTYKGVVHEKPFIGDGPSTPDAGAVESSIKIMGLSAFLMVVLTLFARIAAIFIL